MNASNSESAYRQIPAVDQLLLRTAIASWVECTSREFVVSEIQTLLDQVRDRIRSAEPGYDIDLRPEYLESVIIENIKNRLRPRLRTVVNASGVILHTNLGRAPLSKQAQDSLSAHSAHYTNLEYDIDAGKRSHRDKLIEPMLQEVLGCEAATVVNNNAAAVFMILNTLGAGKEVIVSRGELVEIGGSFRIPDIMSRSGAILREVGTTNKTRVQDYQDAIGSDTAMLLRVHPSNFRMRGFTERPELGEIAALARSAGLALVEDIGSGCLHDLRPYGIPGEPVVYDSLTAGVDLICFSGDKLLGGPQAGIIAGARKFIDPIRRNPLMRTYRVDKLIYGALEATLDSYRRGRADSEIPIVRMIAMTSGKIKERTRRFLRRLRSRLPEGTRAGLSEGYSVVGGGSCPDCHLATALITIVSDSVSSNTIESRLRLQDPTIVVRQEEDRVLVDLRTVFPDQEIILIEGIMRAVGGSTTLIPGSQPLTPESDQ
ncbi:MAG: L-seryl-tRNA(Sec) selenium transferase [Acidobacteria bacterium]|nr:L-seryl-tRNA(Sec) selenium transferase [Acidobacteriota bacterium]